jgi:hypothetical protein
MPEYVYALHGFQPENEDEVAFQPGERIEVLEKDDEFGDGWWKVSPSYPTLHSHYRIRFFGAPPSLTSFITPLSTLQLSFNGLLITYHKGS